MTRSKILEKTLNILIGLKFVKLVLSFPPLSKGETIATFAFFGKYY